MTGYKIALARLTITNAMGLDLRCSALLARAALQFEAVIKVDHGGRVADGKNLMELVALDVPDDGIVTVCAYGHDAQPALQALHTLFRTAFYADDAALAPVTAPAAAEEDPSLETDHLGQRKTKLTRPVLLRKLVALRA